LRPSSKWPPERPVSRASGLDELRYRVAAALAFALGSREHRVGFQQADAPPGDAGLAADFDRLGKPDRPRHQRGEG
jgi:hypothetical protein